MMNLLNCFKGGPCAKGRNTADDIEAKILEDKGSPKGSHNNNKHQRSLLKEQNSTVSSETSNTSNTSNRSYTTSLSRDRSSLKKITLKKISTIRKTLANDYDGHFDFRTGFLEDFKIMRMLGRGAFGAVFLAKRTFGQEPASEEDEGVYAVKRIKKELLKSERQYRSLLLEIEVMIKLRQNLNVVRIEDVYEDDSAVYMVMEYCSGGDLISNVKNNRKFTEDDARLYFQDILRLIDQCHSNNILHRDIKPDNFLKASNKPNAPLKMIDFGLAAKWKGAKKTDMTGTPFYMAPEVMTRKGYGPPADMWSAGCLLYYLISGKNPFEPCDTFQNLKRRVHHEKLKFSSGPWSQVSPLLKDIAHRLLEKDPEVRLTVKEALKHPWIDYILTPTASLNDTLIQRFQSVGSFHRLKRKVLTDALQYLELEESEELIILFNSIDKNNDGCITKNEMIQGLKRHGYSVSATEAQFLIENVDVDGNGELDQNEFVAGLLDLKSLQKQRKWNKIIETLFDDMDQNKDGRLSLREVRAAIPYNECMGDIDDEVQEIIDEVDEDGNGYIDLKEFEKMINDTAENLDMFDKRLRKRYSVRL